MKTGITHTIDLRMLHDTELLSDLLRESEPRDPSHGRYCAPCLSPGGDVQYRTVEELPRDHVPLLEDDYGICCNCGLDTDGEKIPGRAGYQRWEVEG